MIFKKLNISTKSFYCSVLQVLLYATALREAIDEQGIEAKSNGELIVQKMWDRTILGMKIRSES